MRVGKDGVFTMLYFPMVYFTLQRVIFLGVKVTGIRIG